MSSSPSFTHTLPSPEASVARSVLGITSPRNKPEVAWDAVSSVPATSENATHSPSVSDVLVTLTRRLSAVYVFTMSKENVITSVLPASTA